MVLAFAACEKKQAATQVPPSSPAAQTAPPAASPPVSATEPAQTAPPTPGYEQAAPDTGQPSGAPGAPGAPGSSGASGASTEYTVGEGDTLSSIARAHGLNSRDIATWNNLKDPNRIHQGQTLRMTPE
jgi:lipoprotein NlpD